MGIYSDHLFPYALELTLGSSKPMEFRQKALQAARGEVLEIGFGTGLNLTCYPQGVTRLTLLDPGKFLAKRVARRIAAAPMPIDLAYLSAEALPFDAGRFDTVVSTWTLCTIPDVHRALVEIGRVIKPGGQFLFLEHGRSEDQRVARRQDRWNWLQQIIGCGCNLNRPIDELIRGAGLQIGALERFLMPRMPGVIAPHYLGHAVRS